MWTNSKIEVLSSLRLLFKILNLYNKDSIYIGSVKIPDFFVFCLIALPTFHLCSLCLWIAIEKNFDLKLTSASLAGSIAHLQITSSYISLAMKTDLIVSTIDYLQDAVVRSK